MFCFFITLVIAHDKYRRDIYLINACRSTLLTNIRNTAQNLLCIYVTLIASHYVIRTGLYNYLVRIFI